MPDWKGARPDKIQEFWLKSFTAAVHEVLGTISNECTEVRDVPRWLIEERTILVMKDSNKGTEAENYKPIACLNLIWKLLTGVISEKMILSRKTNYYQKNKNEVEDKAKRRKVNLR